MRVSLDDVLDATWAAHVAHIENGGGTATHLLALLNMDDIGLIAFLDVGTTARTRPDSLRAVVRLLAAGSCFEALALCGVLLVDPEHDSGVDLTVHAAAVVSMGRVMRGRFAPADIQSGQCSLAGLPFDRDDLTGDLATVLRDEAIAPRELRRASVRAQPDPILRALYVEAMLHDLAREAGEITVISVADQARERHRRQSGQRTSQARPDRAHRHR